MVLEQARDQKQLLWVFWKRIFQFLVNFWVTKLKPFSGNGKQSVKTYVNANLPIRNFWEPWTTLNAKMNVLSVWKEHFSVSYKFLSDKIQSIF